MVDLLVRTALQGVAQRGRFGTAGSRPGLIVEERTDLALASVIARRDRQLDLKDAIGNAFGIELPDGPRVVANSGVSFAGIGLNRWFAAAENSAGTDFVARLQNRLTGLASIADQTDGRVVLRLRGNRVRDVLAKGVPLDLHHRSFKTGDIASTLVAYIGIQIEQLDDAPTFQLMAFRSLAGSLWSWLAKSAAEFGYEVRTSNLRPTALLGDRASEAS
jgi:methylglutamate dehydrogenase subunit D